jgi:glycosyltransferase involved in cell wall biosynthesis
MITVVVASYKYGHLAAHCLESLKAQTKQPDKIFFVDDGIGDCTHLPKLYPNVEYIFREKNMGVVTNFQNMLQRVQTEKCMFLGADNWLRSDTIELISKADTDIVCYDIVISGTNKDILKKIYQANITEFNGDLYWSRKGGHHGSMLYNTGLAKKVGGYRGENAQKSNEDAHLWNDMIKAGATVTHIEEGLLYYRRHNENYNKDY